MTVTVANTSNTSTFQYWVNRTNELADAMTTKAVTVDSNSATGNATVNGIFSATTLTANTLRGGNTTTAANLSITSNTSFDSGAILSVGNVAIYPNYVSVGNSTVNSIVNSSIITSNTLTINSSISVGNTSQNVSINSTSISIGGVALTPPTVINVQTSGTGSQVIDYFSLTEYRGGEYLITIKDNSSNAYQMNKLLVIHDSGNGYITDYGLVYTNGQLGIFTSSVNATSCIVSVTPGVSNTQIKGTKSLVNV